MKFYVEKALFIKKQGFFYLLSYPSSYYKILKILKVRLKGWHHFL